MTRRAGLAVSAVLIGLLAGRASAACRGENLLDRMAKNAPADYAAIKAEARTMPFGEGVLFRVRRAGLAPSYLFATLHIVDPRLSRLSESTREALRTSRTVALESLDIEGRTRRTRTAAALTARGPERASRLLTPGAFNELASLTQRRGFPRHLADRITAPSLALMLDLPICAKQGNDGLLFPDAQVMIEARAKAIAVVGLETIAEEVTISDNLSPAIQTALLQAVLAQAPVAESIVETDVTLYGQGLIGILLAWTRASSPADHSDAAIPAPFFNRIITARSLRMRDRLLPLLAKGGVFAAIGANHIPGRQGLAQLLTQAGYSVERVE